MNVIKIYIYSVFALNLLTISVFATINVPFATTGNYLGVRNGVDYTPIFIKGVNMGAAVPGSWPGQLAISSQQYARWFRMIADAGFNTVYIYTLHQPRFYEEFARYNLENPEKQLYLFQGVWLREEYPAINSTNDLYSLTGEFDREIKNTVDCIHGNNSIVFRSGQGFGEYQTNVSKWVIGYIIGREIHAAEVETTNFRHFLTTAYNGAHLSIENASPTEAWITERLDRIIAYETSKYQITRPVAASSWPTLDPLKHPSEPHQSGHDDVSVDLNKLKIVNAPAGFFLAYHVYPYYPNFMNNEEEHKKTTDENGTNNFLGYLKRLKSHYTNFPLLISEFGVPTSLSTASTSVSGMNHGGMTEEQQGLFSMRMLKNIYDVNCAGGAMFAWKDEWFKTTWITNPLTSYRRNLWHNLCSPENNFGLIRFAPNPDYYNLRQSQQLMLENINRTDIWHDFATLNLEIALNSALSQDDTLWIAIDTYEREKGESALPHRKGIIENRAEFLLKITSDSAKMYVAKAYDLYGLSLKLCENQTYQTIVSDDGDWQLLRWLHDSNEFPSTQYIGKLNVWKGDSPPKTHHLVHMKGDEISIKIPWTFLNFSDPSQSTVIDDNSSHVICDTQIACGMQYLATSLSTGIVITVLQNKETAVLQPYSWNTWNINSDGVLDPIMFIEVEKESLNIIREGMKNMPFEPK